jgi:hypothetical protein
VTEIAAQRDRRVEPGAQRTQPDPSVSCGLAIKVFGEAPVEGFAIFVLT